MEARQRVELSLTNGSIDLEPSPAFGPGPRYQTTSGNPETHRPANKTHSTSRSTTHNGPLT